MPRLGGLDELMLLDIQKHYFRMVKDKVLLVLWTCGVIMIYACIFIKRFVAEVMIILPSRSFARFLAC